MQLPATKPYFFKGYKNVNVIPICEEQLIFFFNFSFLPLSTFLKKTIIVQPAPVPAQCVFSLLVVETEACLIILKLVHLSAFFIFPFYFRNIFGYTDLFCQDEDIF